MPVISFPTTCPYLETEHLGYTLGGPVPVPFYHGAKKTFSSPLGQWVNLPTDRSSSGATPTADQRNGTFTTSVKDPLTGLPFPAIPPACTRFLRAAESE